MTHHRPFALFIGGALVAGTLGAAVPARAQGILGRARDRARQAISPGASQAAAPCDARQTVGADFVTRYIRALQARETEMRRLAQQNSPVGRYFAAQLLQDSQERRKNDFVAQTGPDWARRDVLWRRMMNGDASASQELSALSQEVERRTTLPDVDWSQMSAANARIDTVTMQGGGFSACDWRAVGEAIPGAVAQIARDPSAPIAAVGQGGLTDEGIAAVKTHRMQLVRLLKLDYKSDEMIARAQRDSTAQSAWNACRQRVMGASGSPSGALVGGNQDSLRVWGAQAQDAQKRGDQAAVMAIAQKIQASMMPNMQAQAMAAGRAQQECGPMPGTPR